MTQAFLFEVQMTGKRYFRMPFITLGVPFKEQIKSVDALKAGADFSSLEI